MSNDTGRFERSLEGVSKVSVWRRILNLIMMFESSPYFEGTFDYFEKRITSLEREVAKLQSSGGPSAGNGQT